MYIVFAVVSFFVFDYDSLYVFFKFGNMSYYQSPKEFSFYAVISVYYSVSCIDYLFCVWYFK